jgi:hypothetical protein
MLLQVGYEEGRPVRCVLIILLVPFLTSCQFRYPVVRLVIPNGYRGVIRVMENPNSPSVVAPDERAVYAVPKDGVLVVDSFRAFEREHIAVVEYADGLRIPFSYEANVRSNADAANANRVFVHDLGTTYSNGEIPELRFYIGTSAEFERWQSRHEE